jgi:hypothetical protein
MEPRIVDQDHQVVAPGAEILPQRLEQAPVGAELGRDFHDPEGGEPLHR